MSGRGMANMTISKTAINTGWMDIQTEKILADRKSIVVVQVSW